MIEKSALVIIFIVLAIPAVVSASELQVQSKDDAATQNANERAMYRGNYRPVRVAAAAAPQTSGLRGNNYSPAAQELIRRLNIQPDLDELFNGTGSQADISYLALRQRLTESILVASLEVRSTIGIIDQEISKTDDLHALLERRRDKALRLTSMANLVTGAFNGIAGNSMDIAGGKLELPASILDVADGAVQSGLAALALKEQAGERRETEKIHGILATFMDLSQKNDVFPDIVWSFLNDVPINANKDFTRRRNLIARWEQMGMVKRHSTDKWEHKSQHQSHATGQWKINIGVLEDRDAMLHDLRAAVYELDKGLLEIMTSITSVRRG